MDLQDLEQEAEVRERIRKKRLNGGCRGDLVEHVRDKTKSKTAILISRHHESTGGSELGKEEWVDLPRSPEDAHRYSDAIHRCDSLFTVLLAIVVFMCGVTLSLIERIGHPWEPVGELILLALTLMVSCTVFIGFAGILVGSWLLRTMGWVFAFYLLQMLAALQVTGVAIELGCCTFDTYLGHYLGTVVSAASFIVAFWLTYYVVLGAYDARLRSLRLVEPRLRASYDRRETLFSEYSVLLLCLTALVDFLLFLHDVLRI